jgi:hypothetical protein
MWPWNSCNSKQQQENVCSLGSCSKDRAKKNWISDERQLWSLPSEESPFKKIQDVVACGKIQMWFRERDSGIDNHTKISSERSAQKKNVSLPVPRNFSLGHGV